MKLPLMRFVGGLLLLSSLLIGSALAQAPTSEWATISSGGSQTSTANLSLAATVGQSIASTPTDMLSVGFAPGVAALNAGGGQSGPTLTTIYLPIVVKQAE